MIYFDTNYFLRIILNDVPAQATAIRKTIAEARSKKIKIISSTLAFFETEWVLKSYYEIPKNNRLEYLQLILSLTTVTFVENKVLLKSLDLFKNTTIGLEDCYHIAYSREHGATELGCFDKRLLKTFQKIKQ